MHVLDESAKSALWISTLQIRWAIASLSRVYWFTHPAQCEAPVLPAPPAWPCEVGNRVSQPLVRSQLPTSRREYPYEYVALYLKASRWGGVEGGPQDRLEGRIWVLRWIELCDHV